MHLFLLIYDATYNESLTFLIIGYLIENNECLNVFTFLIFNKNRFGKKKELLSY